MTKTRVTTSGKEERIATSNIPVSEVEEVSTHASPEANTDTFVNTTENDVPIVPVKKKKRKRANDSVSDPTF